MTTPSYSELVAAVRTEGESLLAAARLGLDVWVPTCREWNVEALVEHITQVWANATFLVSTRATTVPAARPPVPPGEPLVALETALEELVEALRGADADTPVWNWSTDQPHQAAFWARRMAHESSIHRFDAQIAQVMAQPIDADLAGDGLDELIDVVAPWSYVRDRVTDGPVGQVELVSTDEGVRYVDLSADTIHRAAVSSSPAATVRGTASSLLLACYGRAEWSALDVVGDTDLLTRWTETLSF